MTPARGEAHDQADDTVTVAVGHFAPLVGYGLEHLLGSDPSIRILATDLDAVGFERVVVEQAPLVAIVEETFERARLERLSDSQPATGIAVIARSPTQLQGLQCLACGASCVAQGASDTAILDAVRFIGHGGRAFVAADGRRIERSYPSDAPSLTDRETEVLRYLSRGARYAEVAYALEIRPETVRKHAVRIRRKLNVGDLEELIGIPVPSRSSARSGRQFMPLHGY
jgi:DNA-binding NarL/FixJ family response regulator